MANAVDSARRASLRLAALGLVAAACPHGVSRAADTYTLAVVPQFDPRRLFEIWKPLADAVSARSGVTLRLTSSISVADFERQLSAGAFDFVFANPYHLLIQRTRQGYIPLVRDREPLRGILVVAKDSPYASPSDLNGKVLAVPSANALGASILIRADLERLFGVRVTVRDVNSHPSVYLHVANGLVDAGGGVQKILNEQDAAVRDRLTVIYTTRPMPAHPLAAHPRVPRAAREAVQRAILDLQATPGGAEMLARIPMRPAIPTSMDDYLPMTSWGLEAYWSEEGSKP